MSVNEERQRHKREYIRQFMQEYRDKKRKDKGVLQDQIDRLEERVAGLRRARQRQLEPTTENSWTMLPWRDVAAAVHDLRQETSMQHRHLSSRVREYEKVLKELKQWVAVSTISASPCELRETWRDFTLLAHPTSRRLGKLWITQQMYHNTDRVFELYQMPPPHHTVYNSDNIHHSMHLEFSDCGHTFVQKAQKTWSQPLETVVALFRQHTGSMFTLDAFTPVHSQVATEVDGNTTLHTYSPSTAGGFFYNLLCGEFHTADRSVLVVQQLQCDEASPAQGHRLRKRMVWVELRRESPTATHQRILNLTSHETTTAGVDVSLDEIALKWGVDLSQVADIAEKERRVVMAFRSRNQALVEHRRHWYMSLVRTTVQQQQQLMELKAEASDSDPCRPPA